MHCYILNIEAVGLEKIFLVFLQYKSMETRVWPIRNPGVWLAGLIHGARGLNYSTRLHLLLN